MITTPESIAEDRKKRFDNSNYSTEQKAAILSQLKSADEQIIDLLSKIETDNKQKDISDQQREKYYDNKMYSDEQRSDLIRKQVNVDIEREALKKQLEDQNPGFFGEDYANYVHNSPLNGPGALAIDPLLFAKHMRRLANHFGINGFVRFSLTQIALFSLNAKGRVWNPLMAAMPPILGSFSKPALDLFFRDENQDIHKEMSEGDYNPTRFHGFLPPDIAVKLGSTGPQNRVKNQPFLAKSQDPFGIDINRPNGTILESGLKEKNKYNPVKQDKTYKDGSTEREKIESVVTFDELAFDNSIKDIDELNAYTKDNIYSESPLTSIDDVVKTSIAGKFKKETVSLSYLRSDLPNRKRKVTVDNIQVKRNFNSGIIPVTFDEDNKLGFITTREGQSQADVIPDKVAGIPLSFTDLRPIENRFRTVYFRPFLTNVSEDLSVGWNEQHYIGRVDPVEGYMHTTRGSSISFVIAAFRPQDLEMIYKKLHWLDSMCYPEYDSNIQYKSGPVVKIQLGNLFNSLGEDGLRGIPAVIKQVSKDYSDSPWELEPGFILPRHVKITVSLTLLHEKPIGRGILGNFGGVGTFENGLFETGKDLVAGKNLAYSEAGAADDYRSFGNTLNLDIEDVSDLDNNTVRKE